MKNISPINVNRILGSRILTFLVLIFSSGFIYQDKSESFHKIFNDLLQNNVKNGLVNYDGFKTPKFEIYLNLLVRAEPENMSKNERLVFWLNSYNAFAIKNVLDHPGITNPIKVSGFFNKDKFKVAGKLLTLDQIENEIIRPIFNEPLIHFGIVCAARGCPKLQNETFKASTVIDQLETNAQKYLASNKGFKLDRENKVVYLSQIFNWFKEDFTKNGSLLVFILPYLNKGDASFIKNNDDKIKIEFIKYDWTLNSLKL